MTYVNGQPSIDVVDRACVEDCPVDRIYEGKQARYIEPTNAWTAAARR
jgi:hypothetical protein